MPPSDKNLSETDIRSPRSKASIVRADVADKRSWLASSPVCPLLGHYQIAHAAVAHLPAPFEIVRTRLGGSYFLACFGGEGRVLVDGLPKHPRIIDSRVLELSDPKVPDSRQPYHAGFGTAQTDTAKVARLVRGIDRFSNRAVARLLAEYREAHGIRKAGVVAASLTDPVSIPNQHMRAHASEGGLASAQFPYQRPDSFPFH